MSRRSSAISPAVAARVLAAEGVDPRRVQLVDGSGLSTSNLTAPDDLTAFLVNVQREPWFAAWYAATSPPAGSITRAARLMAPMAATTLG